MSTTASLDRIGVGIDTARYGHRVSFLRPDRQAAAKPLTVLESRAGYRPCKNAWSNCTSNIPRLTSTCASTPPASTPPISNTSSAASTCP